jgi:RND family efflux transporter MFP subunit
MSITKQILLSLLIIAVAGGGWLLYRERGALFGQETAAAPAEPGGGPAKRLAAGGASPGGPGGSGQAGAFGPTLVVTAPVEIDDSGTDIRAIGTAAAARAVTLYPQVTGLVEAITFTPGGRVTRGQVLVRLDSADQQVAVERAEIALDAARQAVERAERLEKSGNVTAVALSDARQAEQQAAIDLRSAELELAKRTIRAPFAGVIGLTDVSVGELVNSSKAIGTIADMASVTVAFDVPERVVGRIAVGQEVSATAASLPGMSIEGRISAIDNRIDPATRTMRVEATLPNDTDDLKPGMAITTGFSVPGEAHPSVPSLAIQWGREGSFVWKLDGEEVRRVPVQIVARRSGAVTVAGDLSEGDEVVVEGVLRLRDGQTVAKGDENGDPVPPKREPDAGAGPVSRDGDTAVPAAAAAARRAG